MPATVTAGVTRTDTNAVVVASGTVLVAQAAGIYTTSFTEPAAGLTYAVVLNWTYVSGVTGNVTYNLASTTASSADSLATAVAILNQLYTAAANTPSGINTIMVDGMSTTYSSHAQIAIAIDYWTKRVAFLSGRRRRSFGIRMDRF